MVDPEINIRVRNRPAPTPARVAKHIPGEGTKQFALLQRLLRGDLVDPLYALLELNLPTANARASELRRMGWPVQDRQVSHPKLAGETMVAFYFDGHFREWMVANMDKHPSQYPAKEGRGKFADWTPADFAKGKAGD